MFGMDNLGPKLLTLTGRPKHLLINYLSHVSLQKSGKIIMPDITELIFIMTLDFFTGDSQTNKEKTMNTYFIC
jgi:hypothetical protein